MEQNQSESINNNNNNNKNSTKVCETFFQNMPTDVKERKEYICQVKKALKEEKRKLKEFKYEKHGKHCKRDKHEKHEKHEGFHGHRYHHGGHSECPSVGYPSQHFGGHHGGHPGHHFGGHHGHPGHHLGGHHGHHFGGHHGHPGHHFGGHHGHHFGGHHDMMNGWSVQSKINHLNRKKQVLIAKTQLIESKIAALTELNQSTTIIPPNQSCQDSTPTPQPIESVIGSFSQM
ncbi:hypothetical protein ACTA71_006351 [Dictyostelium dimigraforme]